MLSFHYQSQVVGALGVLGVAVRLHVALGHILEKGLAVSKVIVVATAQRLLHAIVARVVSLNNILRQNFHCGTFC